MTDNSTWSTRTFGNEERLPRLPLPTLDATCEAFLEWCGPLLTPDELARTETAVAAFCQPDGPGRRLHALLERYDAMPGVHSWLETFWRERYLERRGPTALDTNVFFLFRDSDQDQLARAAALVAASVDYKLRLDAQLIPPDVERGRLLSMEQSKYLFGTTRIPAPVRDIIRSPYTRESPGPSDARHVVVFFRGNIFRMDVLGADARQYTVDELICALEAVTAAGAVRAAAEESVGHLTTMPRSAWAASRRTLLECDGGNAWALDTIESALFAVCLDDFVPRDRRAACDHLLHGDSANRWFDKALSLIVFADGTAGLNAEHSRLDGATLLGFVDNILGTPTPPPALRSPVGAPAVPAVEPIVFTLDNQLRRTAAEAGAAFDRRAADTASTILSFPNFGADDAKRLETSPDAFVQLAFQLAHHRAVGEVGATYESVALRQYRRGRTAAMRVVTPEVRRFVATMDDSKADMTERAAVFRAAAQRHARRVQQCQAGQAPEHHLSELQRIQEHHGTRLGVADLPSIYISPGWLTMREDRLSTSRVPAVHAPYVGFGPTGARCIGVAYRLLTDRLDLYLTAPRTIAADLHRFAYRLREAVHELQGLLRAGRPLS